MKGLLQKDLFLVFGKTKTIITLFAVALIMSFSTDGKFVVTYLTLLAAITSLSTISYDEFDNGYPFLFSLPILRRDYVLEKYLFCLLMGIVGMMGGVIFTYGIAIVLNKSIQMNIFNDIISSLSILFVILAIMMPLQLKYGAEKSRIVIILIGGVCTSIGYLASNFLNITIPLDFSKFNLSDNTFALLAIVIGIILVIVSYFLSVSIMNKKEF